MDQGELRDLNESLKPLTLSREGLRWKYEGASTLGARPREIIIRVYHIVHVHVHSVTLSRDSKDPRRIKC